MVSAFEGSCNIQRYERLFCLVCVWREGKTKEMEKKNTPFARLWAVQKHMLKHMTMKIGVCAYWILLAVAAGLIVGAYSTLFAWVLGKATGYREQYGWLLFLLPLGGLVIVWCYRTAKVTVDRGTNLVINSIHAKDEVPGVMAVLIFVSTIITHFFGGSAGREGAALQMGGSLGNMMARILRKNEQETKLLIMCGMSAAFAAVFGTPMAAAVFSMEVISVGIMHYSALVPCMFASLVASRFAATMGIAPEVFKITDIPALTVVSGAKMCLLALCCAGISIVFCIFLHMVGHLYMQYLKNPYIRVFVGGLLIIGLTLLLGTRDYSGAGNGLIERAIAGEVAAPAFLLKMLFTALTLGAGFKGGEIVPSFCIGATFGCLFGQLVGLSPSLCAAAAMAAVFCGVTNCPITTLLISFELFGFAGVPYFMIAVSVSYLLSGYKGLYSDQIIVYSKYRPHFINRHVGDESEDDLIES